MRRLLGTLLSATMVIGTPVAAQADAPHTGLQTGLDQIVATGAVGALAEVRDGRSVWRGTSGVAALGTTRPVPVDGRFRAGSITKTFVATVVLQLVAEGRLRLDDPVEKWFPGVGQVTVRELLNHTSGIYDYLRTLAVPPSPEFFANRWRTYSADELVQRALAHPSAPGTPGTVYAYTNTGYLMLGEIVAKVTGHSYADEIRHRLIRPLGLSGTYVPESSPGIPGPHPHGYVLSPQGLVDYTEWNSSVMGAAGQMISTTADLNRFFPALLGGRLLPRRLLTDMETPGVRDGFYGLGLFLRTTPCGVTVFGNDGDALAYQAWSYSTLDGSRQVTIALTPNFHADLDDLVDHYVDQVVCS